MKIVKYDLSARENKDNAVKARKMTVRQADDQNAIRYRVYCRGKLLDAFNRHSDWPFIWDQKGCRIMRNEKWYEVQTVKKQWFARLVRIYVKPA